MSAAPALGLYLHVPFCRTRCRYCDFYRVGENGERLQAFLGALHREIAGLEAFHGEAADTVFFGGGTPSLLEPEDVAAILGELGRRFALAPGSEVSLEANPSDLSHERLAGYRRAGIDRLSLGVQSFNDRELALLGRRHDAAQAARCLGWAREAGFRSVSLDLMLGIPGQTRASLRRTVERAVGLAPDHVSAYLLEVHGGSEIDGLRRRRPRLFPDGEAQRRAYLTLAAALEEAGFRHYEISNFARPGHECRHNLKYWRREDFLGFGPSAHSCVGDRRWRRPPDLQRYLADPLAEEEVASDPAEERFILALRLADGLPEEEAARLLGVARETLEAALQPLSPWLQRRAGRLALARAGFLVSTAVVGRLLALRGGAPPAPATAR